jgi:hypothetical protein
MATTGGLTLTTTVGVVDGVHGHTTGLGAYALPAVAAGLADLDQLGLGVADLTNGCPAVDRNTSHLGAGKAKGGVVAFLRHELDAGPGGTSHAATATGLELHVVDGGTHGDVAHGQGIAGTDLGTLTVLDSVTHLHVLGGEDVALLAIQEVQQGDAAVPVGVVLDGGDLGRHAILVTTEVDDPVLLLVAAALVASGLAAIGVTATGARLGGEQ